MKRMNKLIDKLNEASEAYYQKDFQIISDFEYDKLYDELVQEENRTGVVLSNSPTQNVGYDIISSLKKVKHGSKMLSLDKTKNIDKLESFLGNEKGLLSWKMDGLTIVLHYLDGELLQAVTRGNGEVGEDITHNAKVFKNIPLKINYKNNLTLRGEAVITFKDFDKINETLDDDEKYKNPRNLCSGTVRQLNSEIAAKRNVRFYAFSVIANDSSDSKQKQLDFLKQLGFETVKTLEVTKENLHESVEYFRTEVLNEIFATDGLVLTFDSINFSEEKGVTSKFPKDSIAFKWADETETTKLIKIDWNTSRTGLVNPVAIFEPVLLEGTTINKASLHNVSIVENLKLGVGDSIKVYKANMIIPQILENLTCSNNIEIPEKCPVCNFETEIKKLKEGKALYCTNPNCEARLITSLVHYTSRNATNIEGLSEAKLERFVQAGFIKNYTDIYRLQEYAKEIKSMEGFGLKSYENLITSIENSLEIELANFIYSLGINQVGLSNAKLLASRFYNSIEKIISAKQEEFEEIKGFGSIISHSLTSYFANEENIKLIKYTLKYIKIKSTQISVEEKKIFGLTFVITGEVSKYKNRKELQKHIETLGGKVTSSVTAKTSFLINNDPISSSSKNVTANELGIKIINEEDFLKLLAYS